MPAMPGPVADERSALLGYLSHQRQAVRTAAYCLTDAQAAAAPTASALSVGGIVRHLAQVERTWMRIIRGEPRRGGMTEYLDAFRFDPGTRLADALADYATAAEETDAQVGTVADLGQPVPVPRDAPWFPPDVDAWSVRWVLLHLIEETARHAGHADIVREAVDGATAIPLLAAAEGWPASGWVRPWTGTSAAVGR